MSLNTLMKTTYCFDIPYFDCAIVRCCNDHVVVDPSAIIDTQGMFSFQCTHNLTRVTFVNDTPLVSS